MEVILLLAFLCFVNAEVSAAGKRACTVAEARLASCREDQVCEWNEGHMECKCAGDEPEVNGLCSADCSQDVLDTCKPPAKCVIENHREKCLCPSPFKEKGNKCVLGDTCSEDLKDFCSPGECVTVNSEAICKCEPSQRAAEGRCYEAKPDELTDQDLCRTLLKDLKVEGQDRTCSKDGDDYVLSCRDKYRPIRAKQVYLGSNVKVTYHDCAEKCTTNLLEKCEPLGICVKENNQDRCDCLPPFKLSGDKCVLDQENVWTVTFETGDSSGMLRGGCRDFRRVFDAFKEKYKNELSMKPAVTCTDDQYTVMLVFKNEKPNFEQESKEMCTEPVCTLRGGLKVKAATIVTEEVQLEDHDLCSASLRIYSRELKDRLHQNLFCIKVQDDYVLSCDGYYRSISSKKVKIQIGGKHVDMTVHKCADVQDLCSILRNVLRAHGQNRTCSRDGDDYVLSCTEKHISTGWKERDIGSNVKVTYHDCSEECTEISQKACEPLGTCVIEDSTEKCDCFQPFKGEGLKCLLDPKKVWTVTLMTEDTSGKLLADCLDSERVVHALKNIYANELTMEPVLQLCSGGKYTVQLVFKNERPDFQKEIKKICTEPETSDECTLPGGLKVNKATMGATHLGIMTMPTA